MKNINYAFLIAVVIICTTFGAMYEDVGKVQHEYKNGVELPITYLIYTITFFLLGYFTRKHETKK